MKDAFASIKNYGFEPDGTIKVGNELVGNELIGNELIGNELKSVRSNGHNPSGTSHGQTPPGMDGNTHVVPPTLRYAATREKLVSETYTTPVRA